MITINDTSPYRAFIMENQSSPSTIREISLVSRVSHWHCPETNTNQYKLFFDNKQVPSIMAASFVGKTILLLRTDYIDKLFVCCSLKEIEQTFNEIIKILENVTIPRFYNESGVSYMPCIKGFCSGINPYIPYLGGIFEFLRRKEYITGSQEKLLQDQLQFLIARYVTMKESSNAKYGLMFTTKSEPIFDVVVNPYQNCSIKDTPHRIREHISYTDIDRVAYNYPATIVWWKDGTKTVVKVAPGEKFNKEIGLAMAIARKIFGDDIGSRAAFKKVVNTAQDYSKIDLHLYRRTDKHNGYLVCSINRADAQKLADAWVCINPDEHGYMMSYAGVPVKFRVNPQETSVSQMKSIIASYNESKAIVADLKKMDGDA